MAFPTLNYSLVNPEDVPSPLGYQAVQILHLSKSITTAMVASGIVTAIAKMPARTRYTGLLYAVATDMDTDGTPALALDLGIAGVSVTTYDDVDCFLDGSDIGQAGTSTTTMLKAGLGLYVPVEHYITLTAATAADAGAAGTFTCGLGVILSSN